MEDSTHNKLEESLFILQSSMSQFKNSGIFPQNIEDLPSALKQLDECLQKSNENLIELKESLKFVLERESALRAEHEVLYQRHQFMKALYANKEIHLTHTYSLKLQKSQECGKKLLKLEEELECERQRVREQDDELTKIHQNYLQEHEKVVSLEKESSKYKKTVEKLHEAIKVLDEEAQTWKERTTNMRVQLDEKENAIEEAQRIMELEVKKSQRMKEKFDEIQKKWEEKEKKWKSLHDDRKQADSELRGKLDEAKKAYKESEKIRIGIEEDNWNLKKDIECLKKKCEILEKDLEETKKKNLKENMEKQRISEELEKFQEDLSAKEQKLRDISEKREKYIKELESQNSLLTEQVNEYKEKYQEKLKMVEEMVAENSKNNLKITELTAKGKRDEEAKKQYIQMESNFSQLSERYQNLIYKLEQSEIQLRTLQNSSKKNEQYHEEEILKLHKSVEDSKLLYEEQIQSLERDKSKLENDLKRVRSDYISYETTTKRAHSEVELWKAGLLDISTYRLLERPRIEDMFRALLGVAPERLTGYDPEQAEYVENVISRMKEILNKENIVCDLQSNEALAKTNMLLQEMTEKYRKEMAERRRLNQLLQEIRGNIRVMCRVRPMLHAERNNVESVQIMDTCQVKVINTSTRRENSFEFDRVFPPTDPQEVIYYEISDLVMSVMNGYNACVMAYGQTGSGKTFTMEGNKKCLGINYRAVREIFELAECRKETHNYTISMTILEIYNDQIKDLLDITPRKIEIREDSKGNSHVQGVDPMPVNSYADIISAIECGKSNRSVGCTNVNEYSSRSHSIVTIYINCVSEEGNFSSKLNLIDLAGSERVWKSEAEGLRMVEACNINQSLTSLGKVLYSLAAKQAHIPYRDSKLTHLLKDSLSGDAKTLMIICVNPSQDDVSETTSSLSFGSRVACVEKGKAKQQIEKSKKPAKKKKSQTNFSEYETSAEVSPTVISPRGLRK
ncbi:unnamed protein product [Blepharisma stoltei]|uniref:Kinesin-like protein n=1 Tax=Blepharisma stoltei TaxID=1481888 RepID=A0AAU9IKR2_9CILI|nr:unnamed protein product [Blepharisma stoltei]